MRKFITIACLLLPFTTSGGETDEIPGFEIFRSVVDGESIITCEATFPEDPINASSISARLRLACRKEAFQESQKMLSDTGDYFFPFTKPVSADYRRGVLWLQIDLRKVKIPVKKPLKNDDA